MHPPCNFGCKTVRIPLASIAAVLCAGLAACSRVTPPHVLPPSGESFGSIDRGQVLMAQYQCARCHEIPDVPGHREGSGPSLASFGRRSYIAGHIPSLPGTLQRWIRAPQDLAPGSPMPALGVSEQDARDMAAYLLSLR